MKDPMTQYVARAAMKSAPAITGAVVVRHSIDWSVLVSCVTMTYTAILAFDVVIPPKNGGVQKWNFLATR